jgi:hypothetical protein
MLYAFTAALVSCCTAGIGLFSFCYVLSDLISIGLMMAVAILNRDASDGCDGRGPGRGGGGRGRRDVGDEWDRWTWGGGWDGRDGFGRDRLRLEDGTACDLYVASFALAIVAVFLFLVTMVVQVLLRSHRNRKSAAVATKGM